MKKIKTIEQLEMLSEIQKVLIDANVEYVTDLKGKPVEVTFDANLAKSFRILTEVI